jgi:Asp-tRNA(Asn)/Glu-tRNA(Gln) amidotransferase A subunit family amidase
MARQIRDRRLSPRELVETQLRHIERVNPVLNAFTLILAEQARAAAEKLERNGTAGALYGLPLTVKDCFDVAGYPTRVGSRLLPDTPATSDSTVVARLKQAGAIVLGKTNVPELMVSYETDNALHGRTVNPWNPECTPGGSSGGEAAAIASYCSAGGVGTDGGGSVRVPAHFCGIAGLKTTPGRISKAGARPESPFVVRPLAVAGPMARTVEDLKLLMRVLAGADDADSSTAPVPWRTPPTLEGLRVGLMDSWFGVPVQDAIREAIARAADLLEDAGVRVEPVSFSGLEKAPNLWGYIFGDIDGIAQRARVEGRWEETHATFRETVLKILERPEPTPQQIFEALAERERLRTAWLEHMRSHPVLLMPVSGITAFRHGERKFATPSKAIGMFQAMMPAVVWNLLGAPALSVPVMVSNEGLPVGVQIVGRPWEDELVLEVGSRLEQARGTFPSPARYTDSLT